MLYNQGFHKPPWGQGTVVTAHACICYFARVLLPRPDISACHRSVHIGRPLPPATSWLSQSTACCERMQSVQLDKEEPAHTGAAEDVQAVQDTADAVQADRPEVQFAPGVLAKLLLFSTLLAAVPLSLLLAARQGFLDGSSGFCWWPSCSRRYPGLVLSMQTDARHSAAVLLSPFITALTPDTRLFAGAIVAIIAVNAVRPCFLP